MSIERLEVRMEISPDATPDVVERARQYVQRQLLRQGCHEVWLVELGTRIEAYGLQGEGARYLKEQLELMRNTAHELLELGAPK